MLLISLVFTVLGLAIISSSISGTNRVETRKADIDVSYNALNVADEITTKIAESLNTIKLQNYMQNTSGKTIIYSTFETELEKLLIGILTNIPEKQKAKIDCISIIDESGNSPKVLGSANPCTTELSSFPPYSINTDEDFTRVFEIVLKTKNPNDNQGKIQRTVRKRLILSPLPSFLKYAVGSYSEGQDSGLFINGSPNIVGNVYANKMNINSHAEYQLRDMTATKYIDTPMPSINGDIYSSTANLLPLIQNADNFYKKKVPALKHDSQFVDINFKDTFFEEANKILSNNDLLSINTDIGDDFKSNLTKQIQSLKVFKTIINDDGEITKEEVIDRPLSIIKKDNKDEPLQDSYLLESESEPIEYDEPIKVDGDFVIMSTGQPITFNDKLVVNGDLYVVSYHDISLNKLSVSGNIHLINFNGKLQVNDTIICGDSLKIESNVANQSDLAKGIEINGGVITGGNLSINPIDTSITINNTIITNGSFTILGNDELDSASPSIENDEVRFNSVVYVGNTAAISNVNILGANDNQGELILLSNSDLMMTRINEFNNFVDSSEKNQPNYLPEDSSSIKPLKAFFYTESEAKLYGVGSLFYINGGLFAKKKLEINAIRGNVTEITNLPTKSFQEGQFSRFIVNFDSNVLLQRIEALPIVDYLQLYSDELILE